MIQEGLFRALPILNAELRESCTNILHVSLSYYGAFVVLTYRCNYSLGICTFFVTFDHYAPRGGLEHTTEHGVHELLNLWPKGRFLPGLRVIARVEDLMSPMDSSCTLAVARVSLYQAYHCLSSLKLLYMLISRLTPFLKFLSSSPSSLLSLSSSSVRWT